MSFVDFILNVVGLLLWLNWRAIQLSPAARPGPSLAATFRTTSRPPSRWLYFGSLLVLLLVRAVFYWQIGSALPWIPHISLEATTLVFRSDWLGHMLMYSAMSFGVMLGIFYLWLLFLSCINSKASENDLQYKLIQLHLGVFKDWPSFLKLLLPLIVIALLWSFLHPVLVYLRVTPLCTLPHLFGQGAAVGFAFYLHLKYLLIGVLVLHLLNSYIYLGNLSFWNFINNTATYLLRPFRWQAFPLIVKKIDFAPVIVIALLVEACLLIEWAGRKGFGFPHFFQKFIS